MESWLVALAVFWFLSRVFPFFKRHEKTVLSAFGTLAMIGSGLVLWGLAADILTWPRDNYEAIERQNPDWLWGELSYFFLFSIAFLAFFNQKRQENGWPTAIGAGIFVLIFLVDELFRWLSFCRFGHETMFSFRSLRIAIFSGEVLVAGAIGAIVFLMVWFRKKSIKN